MADLEIEKWKPAGVISLWHYDGFPKNYCGFHLTADQNACPSLLRLVTCSQKCIPAEHLEIRFRREYSDDHWAVTENDQGIAVEMGVDGLNNFERGIADVMSGKGDWSIGSGKESLWFWWQP